jgi:hypothetical protein
MTARTLAQLAGAIRADRAFWRALVEEVGRDRMDEPGPMGDWTFKDLASHLAAWRNYRIALLEARARGESEPVPLWPAEFDDDDTINAWIRERDLSRGLEDLLADYDGSFERFAAAVEALPQSVLRDPTAFSWSDGESLIASDPTSHLHDGHVPGVRAWLDRRGRPAM